MGIDSDSVGDAVRYLTLEYLEARLDMLAPAPRESGRVRLIVVRQEGGRRESPPVVSLSPEAGVPGDAWGRRAELDREMQIAVMQGDVAELIANGQPLELFGDNLFLELDLSVSNLPPGSTVQVGGATLEVTPKPHNGCRKFRARFGDGALRFVSRPHLRDRNLRGIYMRVTRGGEVSTGDTVEVLARASSA